MTSTNPQALALPDEDLIPEWDLADRMTKSLRVRNLAVQDMADSFGVSRNTIGRWIGGRGTPTKAQLFFWATLTGVNLEWLETGQVSPDVPSTLVRSYGQPSTLDKSYLTVVPGGAQSTVGDRILGRARPRLKVVRDSLTANRPILVHRTRHLASVS